MRLLPQDEIFRRSISPMSHVLKNTWAMLRHCELTACALPPSGM